MIGAKVAVRSVVRNRQRSAMTVGSVAIGSAAILLVGALLAYLLLSVETITVRRSGHLTIFAAGYLDFGAAEPLRYTIPGYPAVIRRLLADPELHRMIRVVTPYQRIFGLVSNPDTGASKTFLGRGVIWSDRQRMNGWDSYGLDIQREPTLGLRDDDSSGAVIGEGVGRMLGLCSPLHLTDCKAPPAAEKSAARSVAALPEEDFSALVQSDESLSTASARRDRRPALDLLASTGSGAPNVVRIHVERAEAQAAKDLDDSLVAVQLGLAQSLVYGRERPAVGGLIVQLNDTSDLTAAEARIKRLITDEHLALEVRNYIELTPFYSQTRAFFGVLFSFIALIVALIVVFTIGNATMMSVIERTSEIGTMRALGAHRASVRNQFLLEGTVLGAAGALSGLVLAVVTAFILNRSGLTWQPPTAAAPIPFRLHLVGEHALMVAVSLLLVGVACVASWLPARRAGRMTVVEALRHV